MRLPSESQTYQVTESAVPYQFWKDVNFLGCIIVGILLGVVILALLSPDTGIPKVHEVMRIKAQLALEIEQFRKENARIKEQIKAMETDPFWQEKIAREELNMALPAEIIYKFTE